MCNLKVLGQRQSLWLVCACHHMCAFSSNCVTGNVSFSSFFLSFCSLRRNKLSEKQCRSTHATRACYLFASTGTNTTSNCVMKTYGIVTTVIWTSFLIAFFSCFKWFSLLQMAHHLLEHVNFLTLNLRW